MLHPDEGTIHAWLDGALPPAEARAFEEHVAGCAECAAAVAQARGVLAAASRILSALDNVPAGVIPASAAIGDGQSRGPRVVARQTPRTGRFRAAQWRAAAAVVIVASASWLVVQRTRDTAGVRPASEEARALDSVSPSSRAQPEVAQASPAVAGMSPQSSLPMASAERTPVASPGAPPPSIARLKVAPSAPMRAAQTRQAAGATSGYVASIAPPAEPDAPIPPSSSDALRKQMSARSEIADARSVISPPEAANRARPDSAAVASTQSYSAGGLAGRAGGGAARDMGRQDRPTTIVVDRAYVDSVLAADSADVASGFALRARIAAGESKMRGNAPAAAKPSLERTRSSSDVTDRVVGCYTLDTTAWQPMSRDKEEPISLVPARIELLRELGLSGDEWGNRLARPAPGEPPLPAGAVAFWKSLGGNKVRIMLADNASWVTLTLVVDADSVKGPARAYSASSDQLRSAQVAGRRVLCRTEP